MPPAVAEIVTLTLHDVPPVKQVIDEKNPGFRLLVGAVLKVTESKLNPGQPFSAVAVIMAAGLGTVFKNVRLGTFDVSATQLGCMLLSNFVPV
jgi:hypothetical protein